jgi:hypothetical protein
MDLRIVSGQVLNRYEWWIKEGQNMNDINLSAIKVIILKILAGLAAAAVLFAGGYFGANAFLNKNNTEAVAQADTEGSGTESVKETESDTQVTGEATAEVEHPEYAAYADILNDSSHEEFSAFQEPLTIYRSEEGNYLMLGLCFAKLIDMDGNGVDELILVDGNGLQYSADGQTLAKDLFTMQIWSYEDGAAQQLYEGKPLSYYGVSYGVRLLKRGDNYYVEVGIEGEYDLSILGYEDGVFGTIVSIGTEDGSPPYDVNGESMGQTEVESYLVTWPDYIEFYDCMYNINSIESSEEEATDESCAIYYTNDPDELQQMVEDVKATCNAKAEEVNVGT